MVVLRLETLRLVLPQQICLELPLEILIIDSVGGTTTIQDNLVVSGDFSSNGATNGNIRIGVTNDNEIDTSSGNLTIDSAGGTVNIDDQLNVTGVLICSSSTFDNIKLIQMKLIQPQAT